MMPIFLLNKTGQRPRTVPATRLGLQYFSISTKLMLITFALLSMAFAAIMPPFQFNDEDGHFIRAFQLSRSQVIGHKDPTLPSSIVALLREFPEQLDIVPDFPPAKIAPWKIPPAKIAANLFRPMTVDAHHEQPLPEEPGHEYLRWSVGGANVYCPIVYVPAAVGVWLSRTLHMPPMFALYMARLFNVLTVVSALALAFRLTPGYCVLFGAVALLPMTLSQAGAISADAVTIACSFVGFAMLLRAREESVSTMFLAALLLVFMAWGLCKSSIWALPLVLLVPPDRFSSRWRWLAYLGAVTAAIGTAVLSWQVLGAESFRAFQALRLTGGINTSANLLQLISHPMDFGRWMLGVIHAHYPAYIHQFIGAFGWRWVGPRLRYQLLAFLVLATSTLAVHSRRPFSLLERMLLLFVFFGATILIHAILFVSDGSPPPSAPASFQGRYFIPFCLAGLLAIAPRRFAIAPRNGSIIVALSGVIHGISSLIVIRSIYYL